MSSKRNTEKRGAGVWLYDSFSSIKLSIWVLIALAVTSIFGTVIQQGKGNAEYVREYGETVANLIGLIPGFMSPTSSLNTTLALTIIVWVSHHYIGIRANGLGYYKHFMGPMWWLVPLMLPIELISNFARLLSLSIRLFGNIMAKETLLGILFMLAGAFFAPLPIMILGVLVSLVQAMVFVLLAVVYFGQAQEHAH